MAVVEVDSDLGGPRHPVRLDPVLQHLAQGDHQIPRGLVTSHVRPVDQRAQVAHHEVVAGFDRSLGPVAPFGRLHLGDERLGQRQYTLGAWLRSPFVPGLFPLEMERGAHGGYPASQELLGDGLLLGGQPFQHGIAVRVAWAQASLTLRRGATFSVGVKVPARLG